MLEYYYKVQNKSLADEVQNPSAQGRRKVGWTHSSLNLKYWVGTTTIYYELP